MFFTAKLLRIFPCGMVISGRVSFISGMQADKKSRNFARGSGMFFFGAGGYFPIPA